MVLVRASPCHHSTFLRWHKRGTGERPATHEGIGPRRTGVAQVFEQACELAEHAADSYSKRTPNASQRPQRRPQEPTRADRRGGQIPANSPRGPTQADRAGRVLSSPLVVGRVLPPLPSVCSTFLAAAVGAGCAGARLEPRGVMSRFLVGPVITRTLGPGCLSTRTACPHRSGNSWPHVCA
jgi:hypothetical protein